MSTSLQIKQIHTLKNILGLDDDLYREILETSFSSSINIGAISDAVKVCLKIF